MSQNWALTPDIQEQGHLFSGFVTRSKPKETGLASETLSHPRNSRIATSVGFSQHAAVLEPVCPTAWEPLVRRIKPRALNTLRTPMAVKARLPARACGTQFAHQVVRSPPVVRHSGALVPSGSLCRQLVGSVLSPHRPSLAGTQKARTHRWQRRTTDVAYAPRHPWSKKPLLIRRQG
jgi:hypothetical protein